MRLKDILVYTPTTHRWPEHIGFAARLALRLQGHLCGLYVRPPSEGLDSSSTPERVAQISAEREQELAEAEQAGRGFIEHVRSQGLSDCSWLIAEGDPATALALAGAFRDLLVLGVGERSGSAGYEPLEIILLTAQMPCLLVPDAIAGSEQAFERIVIAWNGSLAAMRALRAALPLLTRAKRVVLLKGEPHDYRLLLPLPPPVSAEAFLDRHQVNFEVHALATDIQGAGEALLAAAEQHHADLLVMGAYGRPRFNEWLLGGATRHVLRHARLPVVMQH